MTHRFKYRLKLGKDVEMLMTIIQRKDGLVARNALFVLIDDAWVMISKRPSECTIQYRRQTPYFRRRLPDNYKSMHGELFYIDEFKAITS